MKALILFLSCSIALVSMTRAESGAEPIIPVDLLYERSTENIDGRFPLKERLRAVYVVMYKSLDPITIPYWESYLNLGEKLEGDLKVVLQECRRIQACPAKR